MLFRIYSSSGIYKLNEEVTENWNKSFNRSTYLRSFIVDVIREIYKMILQSEYASAAILIGH